MWLLHHPKGYVCCTRTKLVTFVGQQHDSIALAHPMTSGPCFGNIVDKFMRKHHFCIEYKLLLLLSSCIEIYTLRLINMCGKNNGTMLYDEVLNT
jgi:hypothetical protein